jgi:AcrR family transcriptional regulator
VKAKSDVKQTIMTKALELFSAKGYEGVSVSVITEAAGITKPTLYYYFKSKEGLFEDVCKVYYEQLNELITEKAVYNSNPQNYYEDIFLTLSKVTNAYFSFAKTNEAFFRIALANLSMPPSSMVFKIVEKYHFAQYKVIESMFGNMAKAHRNLKGKSKTLTWSFLGTINSYIGLNFTGSGQFAAVKTALNDKAVQELAHQFMHGIFS